jgi:hypothetical protein
MRKDKVLTILWTLFILCLLMAFSLTGISYGALKSPTLPNGGYGGEGQKGKAILLAEAKKRTIPLAESSAKKVMAPPCTVLSVKGKTITLRDFNNQVDTVEVVDPAGIHPGEKGVVKNGYLILGIVPE